MDPAIRLLRDLVAIDSVNPSLVPGAAGEGAIADFIAGELRAIGLAVTRQRLLPIAGELRAIGLAVTRQEALPGRPNVVGILEGRAPGRALMLCGHMDTVTVEGMERPFDPVIRDGRLYGRGAQDMKGGVAAMIDAARVLAGPGLPKGRLVIACVIDEEYESAGVEALVREWPALSEAEGPALSGVEGPALSGAEGPADAAVVTEPTDLAIAIGHRGFAWVEIETKGRAAHGSRPRDGRDAIARMGHVLVRLERLDRELQARPPHPVMGTGSLHASVVQGGRELSSYPDRCVLQIERRTIAGEPPQAPLAEVERILSELSAEDPEFEASARLMFSRPPYEIAATHELPQALRAAAPHSPSLTGMSFWTDAAVLGAAGIASVLFGPGGAGLHSCEEYVRIDDVITCRDTLARLARRWC